MTGAVVTGTVPTKPRPVSSEEEGGGNVGGAVGGTVGDTVEPCWPMAGRGVAKATDSKVPGSGRWPRGGMAPT